MSLLKSHGCRAFPRKEGDPPSDFIWSIVPKHVKDEELQTRFSRFISKAWLTQLKEARGLSEDISGAVRLETFVRAWICDAVQRLQQAIEISEVTAGKFTEHVGAQTVTKIFSEICYGDAIPEELSRNACGDDGSVPPLDWNFLPDATNSVYRELFPKSRFEEARVSPWGQGVWVALQRQKKNNGGESAWNECGSAIWRGWGGSSWSDNESSRQPTQVWSPKHGEQHGWWSDSGTLRRWSASPSHDRVPIRLAEAKRPGTTAAWERDPASNWKKDEYRTPHDSRSPGSRDRGRNAPMKRKRSQSHRKSLGLSQDSRHRSPTDRNIRRDGLRRGLQSERNISRDRIDRGYIRRGRYDDRKEHSGHREHSERKGPSEHSPNVDRGTRSDHGVHNDSRSRKYRIMDMDRSHRRDSRVSIGCEDDSHTERMQQSTSMLSDSLLDQFYAQRGMTKMSAGHRDIESSSIQSPPRRDGRHNRKLGDRSPASSVNTSSHAPTTGPALTPPSVKHTPPPLSARQMVRKVAKVASEEGPSTSDKTHIPRMFARGRLLSPSMPRCVDDGYGDADGFLDLDDQVPIAY